ncbi:MAG: cell division protein FtsQ/DivIB [Thermoleophilia bacterium]
MSGSRPAPGRPVRPRPHPAVAERRRAVARQQGRRRRSGVLLLLGAAVAAAFVYWIATGPLLAVHDVRMKGYDREDRGELIAALERAAGTGTILQPAVQEMQEAASAFPWVESISVARTWPRGLAVDVTEAEPVAVAAFGDQAVLVSATGRVLGPREGSPGLGWMRLDAAPPADGAALPDEARAGLAFMAALPPEVAARVRALSLGRDGALTARLTGGPPLRLGPPERLAAKASALTLVLSSVSVADQGSATYIDLTFPERPALGTTAAGEETTDASTVDGTTPETTDGTVADPAVTTTP